ncbi:MAG: type II toxin-antitoxin system YafQ family toxin [Alphaproteobacteria bacterium]
MLKIVQRKQFRKDFKAAIKRGKDPRKLFDILDLLARQQPLPPRCKLHQLTGNWKNIFDCHIEPDWLLLFTIENDIITLVRTGTHSDLF